MDFHGSNPVVSSPCPCPVATNFQEAEEEVRTDDEELAAWIVRVSRASGNTGGFTAVFMSCHDLMEHVQETTFLDQL